MADVVLKVRVPGIYADDLQEIADEYYDGNLADYLLEEGFYPSVGLTLVTMPGEKCLNSDFGIHHYEAEVVGAEVHG